MLLASSGHSRADKTFRISLLGCLIELYLKVNFPIIIGFLTRKTTDFPNEQPDNRTISANASQMSYGCYRDATTNKIHAET